MYGGKDGSVFFFFLLSLPWAAALGFGPSFSGEGCRDISVLSIPFLSHSFSCFALRLFEPKMDVLIRIFSADLVLFLLQNFKYNFKTVISGFDYSM